MKTRLTSVGFDKLNKRRVFLIEKKSNGSVLTAVEQREIAELQRNADHYVNSLPGTLMDWRALRSLRRAYKKIMLKMKC